MKRSVVVSLIYDDVTTSTKPRDSIRQAVPCHGPKSILNSRRLAVDPFLCTQSNTLHRKHIESQGTPVNCRSCLRRSLLYLASEHTSIKRSLKDDMSTGMDHTVKRMRPKKSRATNRDDTLRLASCRASIASILQVIVLEVR